MKDRLNQEVQEISTEEVRAALQRVKGRKAHIYIDNVPFQV